MGDVVSFLSLLQHHLQDLGSWYPSSKSASPDPCYRMLITPPTERREDDGTEEKNQIGYDEEMETKVSNL